MPGELQPEQRFWLQDGKSIGSKAELAQSFIEMDESTFESHVNESKNDFSNWVRHVLHDEELADNLLNATTKEEAANLVNDTIGQIKGELDASAEFHLPEEIPTLDSEIEDMKVDDIKDVVDKPVTTKIDDEFESIRKAENQGGICGFKNGLGKSRNNFSFRSLHNVQIEKQLLIFAAIAIFLLGIAIGSVVMMYLKGSA